MGKLGKVRSRKTTGIKVQKLLLLPLFRRSPFVRPPPQKNAHTFALSRKLTHLRQTLEGGVRWGEEGGKKGGDITHTS